MILYFPFIVEVSKEFIPEMSPAEMNFLNMVNVTFPL